MYYKTEDLALIVPTKDRPNEIKNLLKSLIKINCKIGRIIIVASGLDIKKIIDKYQNLLNIKYIRCEPGQIKQRNLGISLLDSKTKLVATIDDDLTFHSNSINNIIKFWNTVEPETAGIGFNIINYPKHKYNKIQILLGLNSPFNGRVLKSGINTGISNVKYNIKTEWLNGGATVWKQSILKKYNHIEVNSKWSASEDVIFSYPIGKKYPLYVCANAKVEVRENTTHFNNHDYIFRGKTQLLWKYYFVSLNKDLSKIHYYYYIILSIIYNIPKSIFNKNQNKFS